MANDFKEKAEEAASAFYDLPKTAVQAARSGVRAARNISEQDVVEGIRGATNAVGDTAATIGKGIRGQGEFIADQYERAKPYVGAAARGAAGGLRNMASGAVEGATQLGEKVIGGAGNLFGGETPQYQLLSDMGDYAQVPQEGNLVSTLGSAATKVGDFFTPSNPTENPLMVDRIGDAARGVVQNVSNLAGAGNREASGPFASLYNASAPAAGAQGGASSTTADNIADQTVGEAKPGDAFKPISEGQGLNAQDKAMNVRVANAQNDLNNLKQGVGISGLAQQAGSGSIPKYSGNYNEGALRDNYNNSLGLNSPDTAPPRLPSVATGTPQGGLGAGNATGAAATGRTTGDGSSDPNSPNFQPVGLGGVPVQSAGDWMAQRAQEKQAVYNRRAASNANDRSRMQQESRQALFEKMVRKLPDNLTNRTKSITKLYDSIMGRQVASEGQDKSLQGARERNRSNEATAAAGIRADAKQDAIKNMIARDSQAASQQAARRKSVYDQKRLGQYDATIKATAAKNAVQQKKYEHDVGLAYAKNQREALAAQRAGLKQASDMYVQSVGLPQLGSYQEKLNTVADLSGYSDEQMAKFRAENPQRY